MLISVAMLEELIVSFAVNFALLFVIVSCITYCLHALQAGRFNLYPLPNMHVNSILFLSTKSFAVNACYFLNILVCS